MKLLVHAVLLVICGSLSAVDVYPTAIDVHPGARPAKGMVPDAETAIAIARAVWIPIYGRENIERQKPHRAVLKDGVWHVTGSLPRRAVGGVALAEIAQRDGRILRIIHGR